MGDLDAVFAGGRTNTTHSVAAGMDSVTVCRTCQRPGATYRGIDGEWYCGSACAPEGI